MKRYIPLKEISTIENKNILFKIEKLIAEEKKEGKEYPIANAYLGYYRALLKEKNNKKLLNLTKELYEFLAFGDKYSLKNNKIADEIRDYFYNKIEEIRKIIIKSYNINSLDLFIEDIKNKYEKSRENKFNDILSKDKYLKQIFKEIDEIYYWLNNPYMIGLGDNSQFPTIKQEINWNIERLYKLAKRNFVWPFDEKNKILELKNIINNILKRDK